MEEWRDVPGYEGIYQISSMGRVKSCGRSARTYKGVRTVRERVMASGVKNNGYQYVTLTVGGRKKNKHIHRLVAEAFIPNPDNLPCVNHKNYDTSDNRVENLEWVTQGDNVRYSRERMRRQRKTHRMSASGEKYIYLRQRNGETAYRVNIVRDGFHEKEKTFKTMGEAIAYRDAVLAAHNEEVV